MRASVLRSKCMPSPLSSRTFSSFKSRRKLEDGTPPPCFKYFINKSPVLGVYRESLKIAYSIPDPDTKEWCIQSVKDEFDAFRKFRGKT